MSLSVALAALAGLSLLAAAVEMALAAARRPRAAVPRESGIRIVERRPALGRPRQSRAPRA